MAEHTPTPWFKNRRLEIGPRPRTDDQHDGMLHPVADVFGDNGEADAAFIVKAVNNHEALVEALHGLIIGATCEVNEKGAGGFMLARLSDAKKVLGEVAPDRLTALVGGEKVSEGEQ